MIWLPPAFQEMKRPTGPSCSFDFTYCRYLERVHIYPKDKRFRISGWVMIWISAAIPPRNRWRGIPEIWFSLQGEEQTLLGLELCGKVIALQQISHSAGFLICNTIQTNTASIKAGWAAFVEWDGVLIGVSIDEPKKTHDRYRFCRNGIGSSDKVMEGIRVMQAHEVEKMPASSCRARARKSKAFYRFLKTVRVEHVQLTP
ncbi:hypothetical protein R3X27_11620 [Tropicimonas sp. TH_r6]|uniref:hypothetical protein n=1 Tax=Tropicimonas sp. TH_r6 TaxID=3082085 RepID=UPI002952C7DE|nr:hypothetical protein [Tropicimonas sp. TH_r6]MDV7143331.1 hypothetical protein [Tropicimonas sp. TH_r6]